MKNTIKTYMIGTGFLSIIVIVASITTIYIIDRLSTSIVGRIGNFIRKTVPGIRAKIPFATAAPCKN